MEERIDAAKSYIESSWVILDKYLKSKKNDLERKVLWDKLQKKMTDLNMSFSEQEKVRKEIQHKDAELLRTKLFYKSRR